MSEIKINIRDKPPFEWSLPNEERHLIRICRFHADVLEMEDLHFHLDSAVMLPEREPADAEDPSSGAPLTGLSVLRACLLHAKANPSKKMLVTGHTDRSGPADYNQKLSNLRARNVHAVLTGDADEWASVCADKHLVRDYQAILKWIANVRYWPDCDPGPIDDDHGSGTSRALRAFKKKFNASYGGSLADDATVAAPAWKAFAKMYDVGLAGLLQTDDAGLASYRQALTWFAPAWAGCGDNHPISPDLAANYRSAIDRRVEILFFDPGEEPQLSDCHPSADSCVPAQCAPSAAASCQVRAPSEKDRAAATKLRASNDKKVPSWRAFTRQNWSTPDATRLSPSARAHLAYHLYLHRVTYGPVTIAALDPEEPWKFAHGVLESEAALVRLEILPAAHKSEADGVESAVLERWPGLAWRVEKLHNNRGLLTVLRTGWGVEGSMAPKDRPRPYPAQ